jgi:hypothetical protein
LAAALDSGPALLNVLEDVDSLPVFGVLYRRMLHAL